MMKSQEANGTMLSPKKMTDEELGKSLQRLYEMPCQKKKKKVASDALEIEQNMMRNKCRSGRRDPTEKDNSICERLYAQPLKLQKLKEEALDRKYMPGPSAQPKVALSDEQAEEAVHRLYAQSMEHKKQVRAQSEKRIYGQAPPARRLDNETLKENITKLYSKAVEAKQDKHHSLEERYIWKMDHSKKITKTQLTELVGRLGATK
ncbi:hypothetical protein DIPPA_19303 [Diplonema papillatum]|nr:hypothetical protein DIPPA_19303 [Diplonema papillatum]